MDELNNKIVPKKRIAPFLLVANIIIVLFSTIFVFFFIKYFNEQINNVKLNENRFITMEWNLLKKLKLQTDYELLQKDREIEALRLEYNRVKSTSQFSETVIELENKLERAESERSALVLQNASSFISNTTTVSPELNALNSTQSASNLNELFITRIQNLETELANKNEYLDKIDAELKALKAQNSLLSSAKVGENQNNKTDTYAKTAAVGEIKSASTNTDSALKQINTLASTWTLIRAIAGSTEIKNEYPNLLQDIDTYIEKYGQQERLKGKKEAFSQAIEIINAQENN